VEYGMKKFAEESKTLAERISIEDLDINEILKHIAIETAEI
jgi:hypothetical protein